MIHSTNSSPSFWTICGVPLAIRRAEWLTAGSALLRLSMTAHSRLSTSGLGDDGVSSVGLTSVGISVVASPVWTRVLAFSTGLRGCFLARRDPQFFFTVVFAIGTSCLM